MPFGSRPHSCCFTVDPFATGTANEDPPAGIMLCRNSWTELPETLWARPLIAVARDDTELQQRLDSSPVLLRAQGPLRRFFLVCCGGLHGTIFTFFTRERNAFVCSSFGRHSSRAMRASM